MVERHAGGLSLQLMFDRNLHGMPEAALRLDMLAETLSAMPDSADIAVAAIDALPAILLNPLLDKASPAASISAPAQTVVAKILDHAARAPHAPAVIKGGHRLTYHQHVNVHTSIEAKLASYATCQKEKD